MLAILATSAGLFLAPSAKAAIAIQDAPSPIEYNGGGGATLNGASYTVSPGASVLVVFISTRNSGSANPGNPSNVKWNGNTLNLAVAANTTASTYDYNLIYYLTNPPAGTGPVTGTLGTGVAQTFWMAYTLSGATNSVAPLTGSAFSTSGQTINNTVVSVPLGAWAAVSGSGSANNDTPLTITDAQGGTGLTFTTAGSSATETMGSVSNCVAGNNQFTLANPNANQKLVLCEAIFSPVVNPPQAPNWVSVTTGNPAQVNLSWSSISNAASYLLSRGTINGGPYTDFTNVLSSTNFQDRQVLSGTQYYYVVSAANSAGTNTSVQTNATPVGTVFPPVLGGGAAGVRTAGLVWTPPFGATNYIVLAGTSSGGEVQIATTTSNKFTVSGLTPGSTNYFTVEAVGASGTSGPSDEISVIALGSPWHLFDNFSLDAVGAPLNGATGSAGLGQGWTNLGGGSPIFVTNTTTPFGAANYAEYTPSAVTSIGDYEAGLGIPGTSKAATVFLEFSLPGIQSTNGNVTSGGSNVVAMNFDIDNANPPTALTGQSIGGPSAQFNYDNSSGSGYFRILGGNTFYFATIGPTNTPYLPIAGNVYYFWFVVNAANGTCQIYLADGSETGTNLDSGGLGAAPTLMWGATATNTTGSLITFGFRNITAGATNGAPVNYIGTGPGSNLGSVPQNQFANIFVDSSGLDLTNPVTGQPPTGTPQVLVQPQPLQLFAGSTAVFSVVGSAGVNFQWQSNGVSMVDGGSVSGSATSTLTISNVTSANAANYSCIVNDPATSAFASSSPASLSIVTPTGAFESAIAAAGASHFYAFNDSGNPATGTEVAFDNVGSDNGVYGANAQNGFDSISGPTSAAGFPGFPAVNPAVQLAGHDEPNNVTVDSPWNLNTDTVTITAWINPSTSTEPTSTAIVLNRGAGNDVEGLIFNTGPNFTLGYEWNNDTNTTSWDSGLLPPAGLWSFVALTVTPTNATLSMMNTNGVFSATHTYPHPVAPFAGTTMIGDDPGTINGALTFNGIIDEVGVFDQALSEVQVQTMYSDGSGLSDFPATNTVELLTPEPLYPGQSAAFSSVDGGSYPMAFIWQLDGTNLTDGASSVGVIIGSATPSLIISNLAAGDANQTYSLTLVSSNTLGAYTSSVPAMLTVSQPSAAGTITTTEQEAQGADWNTGVSWSDNNPVSVSIYSAPGSTYEVVPGTLERSPISTNAAFPGTVLVLEGNGVLLDGNAGSFATQTTTGELRLKPSGTATATNLNLVYTVGGSVTFPDLQLNGGQIDNGGNGTTTEVDLDGRIDVLANSAIYADSASAGYIRTFQVNAFLTGTGTITYTDFGGGYPSNALVVSCPTNTFSGQWNVQQGVLVGTAPNSLGTNSISIGTLGALETTYNLSNSTAALILNGQMHLYTTDTFYGVILNGTNMPPGTYSFAQLNTAYPSNFPASWQAQVGSLADTNTGVGSLTVLGTLPPVFTQQPASLSLYPGQTANFTAFSPNVTSYQWWFTNLSNVGTPLSDGGGVSGSATNSLTITNVSSANAGTYVVVASDAGGSTISGSATLTILAAGPPETITTTEFEPGGDDWNTAASWNDDLAASVSVYANPGSTYEIMAGTLERTPVSTNAVFPGNVLVVDGNGVLLDGASTTFTNNTTTGELRLKESGTITATNFGTVYTQGGVITFPDLQLNGGQVDNGNSSAVTINGQIDVLANSSIYADSAANGSIRSIQINALLTGTGMITYSYVTNINYTNNDLIISGTANTFSGQWNIEQGALLGNAPNSLGTNSITIGTTAALETTYNLRTTNGSLTLNGQMYLYTDDTFYALTVNGTAVSTGRHTFAQLNSAFPANFPVTWPVQLGSSTGTNTGSGSITVLTGPPPPTPPSIGTISISAGNVTLSGSNGIAFQSYNVLTSTNLSTPLASWSVVASGSFAADGTFSVTFPEIGGQNRQFYLIQSP